MSIKRHTRKVLRWIFLINFLMCSLLAAISDDLIDGKTYTGSNKKLVQFLHSDDDILLEAGTDNMHTKWETTSKERDTENKTNRTLGHGTDNMPNTNDNVQQDRRVEKQANTEGENTPLKTFETDETSSGIRRTHTPSFIGLLVCCQQTSILRSKRDTTSHEKTTDNKPLDHGTDNMPNNNTSNEKATDNKPLEHGTDNRPNNNTSNEKTTDNKPLGHGTDNMPNNNTSQEKTADNKPLGHGTDNMPNFNTSQENTTDNNPLDDGTDNMPNNNTSREDHADNKRLNDDSIPNTNDSVPGELFGQQQTNEASRITKTTNLIGILLLMTYIL